MSEYAQSERVLPAIIEDKALRAPYRKALSVAGTDLALGEIVDAMHRFAHGAAALGIRPGDRVALMMPNCAEQLFAWWGLNRLGAVDVPINTAQRGDGLVHQITRTRCVALVAHQDHLPVIAEIAERLPEVRHVVVLRRDAAPAPLPAFPGMTALDYATLVALGSTPPPLRARHRDLSTIIFTSGTTGLSKGVTISHNYWYEIWSAAVAYARYTEDDVLYAALPLFHVSARGTTVGPALLADARAVVGTRFSASRMMDECRKHECTSAKYIGSILPTLMKQPPREDDADNPLRLMVGAAAPTHLHRAFEQRFNTKLLEGYGATECAVCLVNPFDSPKVGSCGKPITGWDVRVVDDDDNPVPPGVVGEIVARPQRPFLGTAGYDGMPEATLELFRNLWVHTGDLGHVDAEGYFYFVDRRKQALRRRGENISSFEVEAVINAHPAVSESCVVGVPSELGEEEVKAVIVLQPGARLSAAELAEWCAARLAAFAVPRYIAFRASLPKTPSERVEKHRLKAEGVTGDCWDREARAARTDSGGAAAIPGTA